MKESTLRQFVSLKAQGHKSIFHIAIEGRDFLVRPLTFSEYRLVLDLESTLAGPVINDTIVRMATLHIEEYDIDDWLDDCMPASPDKLAEVIIKNSGFQNEEVFMDLLIKKREEAQEFQSIIQMYICSAFKVAPDDVFNMTMEEQLDLFAKAEYILGKPVNIEEMMGKKQEDPRARKEVPAPEGMESIKFDEPDWDRINAGEKNIY